MTFRRLPIALLTAFLCVGTPSVAFGQLGGLGRAAKRAVQGEAERQVQEAVTESMRCALGDDACIEEAKKNGQEVEVVDEDGNVMSDAEVRAAREAADGDVEEPGTGVWRNYDFVPGSDVWFALDLENEPIGRFPASQLQYVEGNAQVVEVDGQRALEFTAPTTFYIDLPEDLPEDFTLELEAMLGAPNFMTYVAFDPLSELELSYSRYEKHYLSIWRGGGIAKNANMVSGTDDHWEIAEQFVPIKFQNDGSYAIVYMGSDRVSNVPNAEFGRSKRVEFHVTARQGQPSYLRNIVVAVGLDDLYGTLAAGEAWTTRGVLFDVDSDVLRPESTAVLQQILRTLEQHEDLAVVIEGHTDSTGDDAHNQQLSERRAASVVAWLTGQGIDAGRLTAVGKGETEPVADNATPAGRQENRRVVVRKAS